MRLVSQAQRVGGEDGDGRRRIAPAGQDVEDDGGGVDAVGERLAAQAASTASSPSVSTAVRIATICRSPSSAALQPAPHPLHGRRQHPVLERRAVAQRAGLAGQHRHVVPGIVDRLAAAEASGHARRRSRRPGG